MLDFLYFFTQQFFNIFSFLDNIEEIYEQLEVYIKDDQATSKLNENNFKLYTVN